MFVPRAISGVLMRVAAAGEQLKDRDSFDKAQRAYVSYVQRLSHLLRFCNVLSMYVRAYKEHQCSFIFQLKQLDYGALANQVAQHFITNSFPSHAPRRTFQMPKLKPPISCAC